MGLSVHHHLLELSQTHVLRVSDAIQPSHPLSSPSPPSFNLFQHQGLFHCQFIPSGGQSSGVSASASVLPMNIQDWFPSGRAGWISLQSKGFSRVFSNTQFKNINSLVLSLFYSPTVTSIHDHWKNHSFEYMDIWIFVGKVMSLIFNMLSRLVIAFLPRSKNLLISWLQSPSTVILKSKTIKSVTVSVVSPSICHEVMGPDAMILAFWMLSFKPDFSLSSFTFVKRLLIPLCFLP